MTSNLTRTWLNARQASGDTRAAALRHLNAHAGTSYTNSRLNEWLRGDREPNRQARAVMLRDLMPELHDTDAWT